MLGADLLWLCAIVATSFPLTSHAASQGDVRLVNGPNPYEGRVEYHRNGVWLSLCSPYVYHNDYPAMAVCRQLGFAGDGAMRFYGNSYGSAPGEIFRGEIYCYGYETSLSACSIRESSLNCNPSYALGVSCQTNVTASSPVRLEDGSTIHEGRLEIFINGVWGTVCRRESPSYIFHHINAHVACKQMFGSGFGGSYFPPWTLPSEILGSGAILRESVRCSGSEDNILNCPHNSTGGSSCTHEDDVAMECYQVPNGCGAQYTEFATVIQSPGYPHGHNYSHDTNCTWTITWPSYTHLYLAFPHIQASDTPSASDNIYVVDRDGYSIVATSTGGPISNITRYGNWGSTSAFYIRLQAAEGTRGIRFTASLVISCDVTFTSSSTYIYSPGYSGSYPPNIDCTYTIRQSDGYNIRLDFYSFALDSKVDDQCGDFIKVYDGDGESSPLLGGPYCGSTRPPTLTSTQNVVTIRFHSDNKTTSALRIFYIFYNSFLSACNRNFSSSSGTLYSPGYPGPYPPDLNCPIFIRQSVGYIVRLQFSVFSLDAHDNGTCRDFLQVYDGDNMSAPVVGGPYCGSITPSFLFSTQNVIMIRFNSDGNTSQSVSGFQINYARVQSACDGTFTLSSGFIDSPGYSLSYPPNMKCKYTVRQAAEFTIQLQFINFALDNQYNGTCLDFVVVYNGDSESSPLLGGPYCGSTRPSLRSTQNVVTIRFQSDNVTSAFTRMFSIYYSRIEPAPVITSLTNDTGMLTSPNYPDMYRNETDYVWHITATKTYRVIVLTFADLAIRDCSSVLQIRDGSSSGTVLASICGIGIPSPVMSSSYVMYLRLFSTNSSVAGNRFNALWTTDCGQTITALSGVITSPEHPAPYPPGMECGLLIRQTAGYFVTLDFTSFQLDDADFGGCQDYVEVHDGESEFYPVLGGPYCGTSLPSLLSSTQNSMFVRFHSDNVTANSTGFRAVYQRTECRDQTMTAREGNFTSPGFPFPFPRNSYCIWTITVHPNDVIELTFEQFHVWCNGAYVRLYDSPTTDVDRVIDTFCRSNNPPKITTRGNSLTAVLNSFGYSPSSAYGFRASYVSIDREDADVSQYDLFPYGPEQGDEETWPSEPSMQNVTLQAGFPFGTERHTLVHIGKNGMISVGNTYPWPQLPRHARVVCAYCAYINKTVTTGRIFYHVYGETATESDVDILKKATREVQEFSQSRDFIATLALVVTWDRVKQGRYSSLNYHPENEAGDATFQIALITNGFESYVLVYYLTGAMTWAYRGRWSYVVMGYSDGKEDYQLSLYSSTRAAYNIDSVTGNTGRKGIWIYKVGEMPLSPSQVCWNWYFRNSLVDRSAAFAQLPRCPCSAEDVWRKTLFLWTFSRTVPAAMMFCYQLNQAASRRLFPYGKECCYSYNFSNPLTFERLEMDPPYAGSALAYNPSIHALRTQYEKEDQAGHEACCLKARNLCPLYYKLRPIGECQSDIPFRDSWLWGDPHIKTLDDREYTFNGWGEYTLVTIDMPDLTFTVQGRTGLMEVEDGRQANATVFTAFGAEENGTRVFVGLNSVSKDALEIYANDRDYSRRFQEEEDFAVDEDNYTMFRDNDSIVISFPSGISLAVALGNRTVAVSVSIPVEFRDKTRGLLGNYNGVQSDEFILPNGTVLSDNMTDRQIHYDFGQQWAVTEDNTVLRYGPRERPANYSHPHFVPVFLEEVSKADRQLAQDVCGADDRACIYDYIVTGSQTFASATRQTGEQASRENAIIRNSLPELEVPVNVSVASGNMTIFRVLANDSDGDNVTYRLVDTAEGIVQLDNVTGVVTANISSDQPVEIRVYAVDAKGGQSTVRQIQIVACSGCNKKGDCDFSQTRSVDESLTFRHAVCVCHTGWTGDDCDVDRDACVDSPCDPLQNCTDLAPQQEALVGRGYNCSQCPAGYATSSTDGSHQCLDIDECFNNTLNECVMWCNNTAGGYGCLCDHGYRLSDDGHSCNDINECAEKSHDCQHICNNTDGGFQCLCESGYDYNVANNTCDQNVDAEIVCQSLNCSQGCRLMTNSSDPKCFCQSGYDLDLSDDRTCVDRDECEDAICAQACNNTEGSFSCSCYAGYQLNADQRTCTTCPSLTYGPECGLNCSCSGRGVHCHPVMGCVCQKGWTGSECKADVDECEENPDVCGKDMMCINNAGSYTCSCFPGYGKDDSGRCADIDECKNSAACGELERCTNVPGTFICTCRQGYQPHNGTCTDIDECSVTKGGCQHQCANMHGSYNCDCYYGYSLNSDRRTCSRVREPCSNSSCDHGCTLYDDDDRENCFCRSGFKLQTNNSTCVDNDECVTDNGNCSHTCNNTEGGFLCSCPLGMMLGNDLTTCHDCPNGTWGENCTRVCQCGAGADRCNVTRGCICKAGWRGDRCADDVDECQTVDVQEECLALNAECVNFQGGYRCQCRPGYTRQHNGTCQDIDECDAMPCSQRCENSPGSYRCLCYRGFSLDNNTGDCTDIDECRLPITHACTQRCQNTIGSYRCSCDQQGYVLGNDGYTCIAQTQCGVCNNTNGGCVITESGNETCFCNSGYELDPTDNRTCKFIAIDWCDQNVCDQNCTVAEDKKSFTCSCTAGFLPNDDKRTCRVCPQGTYGEGCLTNCTCSFNTTQSCDTVMGRCNCLAGWTGATCTQDLDECELNKCGEHATCNNRPGSFICTCKTGYIKTNDTFCTACPSGTYGEDCKHQCNCTGVNVQSCDNVNGTCHCKAGWEGTNCDIDRDECSIMSHDCSGADHEVCVNIDGGFTCHCQPNLVRNDTGQCVGTQPLKFEIKVDVNYTGNLSNSSHYDQLKNEWATALYTILNGSVPGLVTVVTVNVTSIRLGSLMFDTDVIVYSATVDRSGAELAMVLLNIYLNKIIIVINSENASVVEVKVGDLNLTNGSTICDLYLALGVCAKGDTCTVKDGRPSCRPAASEEADSSLGLVVGLVVGIPVFGVMLCVIGVCCYQKHKKEKDDRKNFKSDELREGREEHMYDVLEHFKQDQAICSLPRFRRNPGDGQRYYGNLQYAMYGKDGFATTSAQ